MKPARNLAARHQRQCLQFDQDDVFLCALLLADRASWIYRNVSDYWPEFAQNGKQNVKVWHFMNHAAGLSGMDTSKATPEDMYD